MSRQRLRYKILVFLVMSLLTIAVAHTSSAQDFTALSLGDYGNVTVMEVTGNYDAYTQDGSVNSAPREAIAKEFFKTHKDEYDFLVIFTNFDFLMPDDGHAKGFYLGIKNNVQGIGQDIFDNTSFFGSIGRLQGAIEMGNISTIATDPLDPKFEDTLYMLSHESMHRWAAYVKFKDSSGNLSNALLGKDGIHWSYLLSSGSVLYGNQWQDKGNGTFTSVGEGKSFSPLDLYLMGMIDKSKVPPMLLIDNSNIDPAKRPQAGETISGTARYVTIDDIIATIGPRAPDAASSQKNFKTAFILLSAPGAFTGQEIYGIENIRNGFVTRHSILTDGQSIVEVASTPKDDVPTKPGVLPPSTTPRTLPPNIEDGVAWLMNNQQPDGSWTDDVQTAERDTAEAVHVLKNFTVAQQSYQAGLGWLTGLAPDNADYLAKKIETLAASGQDALTLLQELLSMQNSGGGWGKGKNYWSNPTDTSLALKALSSVSYSDQEVILKAIGYLKSQQNTDGGWGSEDKGGMVQETSNVLSAFCKYRTAYQLDDAISRGTAWLLSRQNPDGGFGNSPSTVYDTAMAVLALRELNISTDITNRGLEYLLAQQSENGSWQNSVYQTALAVNAVYKATVDPDLSIKTADIAFIPASVTQLPSNIVINANIWNAGRTSVSQAKVALYENSVSDANKLAEQAVAFPGRQATTVTFSVTISDGNEHRYYIVVDPGNLVKESSEANNSAVSVIRPEATYDFEVHASDITVSPAPVDQFQDVTITARITNKGTMNAYNVQVKYFIDDPSSPYELGTMTVDIPANTTVPKEVTWRANRAGTNLPIAVQADPFDNFAELSETNNKASASLTVNPVNLIDPNLTVSYQDIIITPTPANERGSVNISALVKNDGFSSGSNIVVNFYRGVPGPNGLLLGAQTIASLAPNESARASIDWTNIQESGEKIIYIQVDYAGQEIRKDGNDAFTTLNILSLPDLEITANSISFAPSAPKDGDTVTVTASVQNKGEQSATNVQVTAYEGNTVIGTQAISHLAGNTVGSASFSYETTGKTGVHQIAVVIDPDNAITEQSENNNSASKTIGVQDANLWVSEQYFSPNGDGVKDSTQFFFRLQSPQTVKIIVMNSKNEIIRTFSGPEFENTTGGTVTWDGLNDGGMVVADGQYQIRLAMATNTVLGSLSAIVDNNRSPLTDAFGTDYLYKTCSPRGFGGDWKWFPDESGMLFSMNNVPEYSDGLYIMSPDGSDISRLSPKEWSGQTDPDHNYGYNVYDLSSDGAKIAFVLNKYNKGGWRESTEHWITDRDGKNLTLLDSYLMWDTIDAIKLSPHGDYVVYNVHKAGNSVEMWTAKSDGTGKTLVDTLANYYDMSIPDIRDIKWSADGRKAAYIYNYRNAFGGLDGQIRVYDMSGSAQTVLTVRGPVYRFAWVNDQKIIAFTPWETTEYRLVDATGAGNNVALPGKWTSGEFAISPDRQSVAFIDDGSRPARLYVSDIAGITSVLHEVNYPNGYPDLRGIVWSPDGSKIAVVEERRSSWPSFYSSDLIVIDVKTRDKKRFPIGYYSDLLKWLPDGKSILGSIDNGINVLNSETGASLTIESRTDSYWVTDRDRFVSPRGNHIVYPLSPGQAGACPESAWVVVGSLMNLTADIAAVKAGTAVTLRGTAADLNFEGHTLEYADAKNPGAWNMIQPLSDLPVISDVFTSWIPPYEGVFDVRLTARDKAGNVRIGRRKVSWGQSSSIANIYKSFDMFSPNGDGVKDALTVSYTVLAPLHLEFNIYSSAGQLIRTIVKDEPLIGQSSVQWDGTGDAGVIAADGRYAIKVLDHELSVIVDNTPPKSGLVMVGLNRKYKKDGIEFRSVHRDIDLFGYAVDENLKEYIIMSESNGEWTPAPITKKFGAVTAPVIDGSIGDADSGYAYLGTLNAEPEAPGFRHRIDVKDHAGNVVSVSSPLPPEEAGLYEVLSDKFPYGNPLPIDPEKTQITTIKLALTEIFAADGKTLFPITVLASHSIREKIRYAAIQYWIPGLTAPADTAIKTDFPSRDIEFTIDTAPFIQYLRDGPHEVQLRGVFIDVLGREFYTNTIILKIDAKCQSYNDSDVSMIYPDTGCGEMKKSARIGGTLKFSRVCVDAAGNRTVTLMPVESGFLSIQKLPDGRKEVLLSRNFDPPAYPASLATEINVAEREEGSYKIESSDGKGTGASETVTIDHHAPNVTILSPAKGRQVCPVEIIDSTGQARTAIPIEVMISDNFTLSTSTLLYGSGDTPASWLEARLLNPKKIEGLKEFAGTIFYFDTTDILLDNIGLKLTVSDAAGNRVCNTVSFALDREVSLSGLNAEYNLFSPIRDSLPVTFSAGETTVVNSGIYEAMSLEGGSLIPGATPVRKLIENHQYDPGVYRVSWDGRTDTGAAVPDGKYVLISNNRDSCGNTAQKWSAVRSIILSLWR